MENPIYFCYNNGIIKKIGTATFTPNSNMTRGQALYGVVRALGLNPSNSIPAGQAIFTDVPSGHQYAGAIYWAYANGVTAGMSATTFGVNNSVQRQQFCVFVYKACIARGVTLPQLQPYVAPPDASSISAWALTAVIAVYRAELISGFTNGNLGPLDYINRAAAAVMLMKLYALKHYGANTIIVYVWNRATGVSVSGASVYLYYENSYPYPDKYPEQVIYTNINGIASVSSTTSLKHAINVFKFSFNQGFSNAAVNRSRFIEAIAMTPCVGGIYAPPIEQFDAHATWGTTRIYIDSCMNFAYRYGLGNQLEFHQGLDIGVDPNIEITSCAYGYVSLSSWMGSAGNVVQIHGGANYITYQHLNERRVSENQTVTSSTIIGKTGNTGGTSSQPYDPHLHISYSHDASISTDDRNYFDPVAIMLNNTSYT